jgi:hypothetical protein
MPTLLDVETSTLAALDLGTTFATARVVVYDVSNLKLAEFAMSFPAFPVPTDTTTDANVIQQALAASAGTPDHFEITDRTGAVKLTGTIGSQGSGADIEVVPIVQPVVQGQILGLDALAYTQVDLTTGLITGVLESLFPPRAPTPQAPTVREIEFIDLVRAAEGPVAFANRDWDLEYEFANGRQFWRRGNYTS